MTHIKAFYSQAETQTSSVSTTCHHPNTPSAPPVLPFCTYFL